MSYTSTSYRSHCLRAVFFWVLVIQLTLGVFSTAIGSLAIGMQSRGIFLQEYWEDNVPYYAVFNSADSSQTISLQCYHLKSVGFEYEFGDGPVVASWELDANSLNFHPSLILDACRYIRLSQNEESLGLIYAPVSPDSMFTAISHSYTTSDSRIVTFSSMNGWGIGPSKDLWVEQDSLTYSASQDVEVVLYIESMSRKLVFGNPKAIHQYFNPHVPFNPSKDPTSSMKIAPYRATSDSASMVEKEGAIEFQLPEEDNRTALHKIKLQFHLPRVLETTVMYYTGWLVHDNGNRSGFSRMLVVEP